MHVINARNAHQALPKGLRLLTDHGVLEKSRAGDVLRFPTPVTTVLSQPQERVVFHAWRDANPFFHIVEAAWMLAGRDDLKALTPYVARMAGFSDDGGITQPGAYGKRWRDWSVDRRDREIAFYWNDQLDWVVRRLRANSSDRRTVIQMWDPYTDMSASDNNGADVPCNLTMIPWVAQDALHLTIFNRSNDIIWGLYGANAVHFSMVLEYLAGRIGVGVGTMTTISNNFHAYVDKMPADEVIGKALYMSGDPYYSVDTLVEPFGLLDGKAPATDIMKYDEQTREVLIKDALGMFFDLGALSACEDAQWPWMTQVLAPMALAHRAWKNGRGASRYTEALKLLDVVAASDWRLAGQQWIKRRQAKFLQTSDDGVTYD